MAPLVRCTEIALPLALRAFTDAYQVNPSGGSGGATSTEPEGLFEPPGA
jgi:hypothetical protein